jgi:hypothetical protein
MNDISNNSNITNEDKERERFVFYGYNDKEI